MEYPKEHELYWETVNTINGSDYAVFTTEYVERRHPHNGQIKRFSVIKSCDWVNVIAMTPEHEMLWVRQYRHGTAEITLELPGGMIDAQESTLAAAQRELREETGYTSTEWVNLGVTKPNPAIQSNQCTTWLALNAQPTHPTEWGTNEVIQTVKLSSTDIEQALQTGEINHALVLVALYWYDRYVRD